MLPNATIVSRTWSVIAIILIGIIWLWVIIGCFIRFRIVRKFLVFIILLIFLIIITAVRAIWIIWIIIMIILFSFIFVYPISLPLILFSIRIVLRWILIAFWVITLRIWVLSRLLLIIYLSRLLLLLVMDLLFINNLFLLSITLHFFLFLWAIRIIFRISFIFFARITFSSLYRFLLLLLLFLVFNVLIFFNSIRWLFLL